MSAPNNILFSIIIQTAMLVLMPVKKMCNNSLHTTAATVYTKTKSVGDTAKHINTKQNEVYGMSLSMQLTDDSVTKPRSERRPHYGQTHVAM